MTYKEAKRKTRLMWVWLRDHYGKTKDDYCMLHPEYSKYACQCALCEYFQDISCIMCPLHQCVTESGNGIYNKWVHAVNEKEAMKAAQTIIDKVSM